MYLLIAADFRKGRTWWGKRRQEPCKNLIVDSKGTSGSVSDGFSPISSRSYDPSQARMRSHEFYCHVGREAITALWKTSMTISCVQELMLAEEARG